MQWTLKICSSGMLQDASCLHFTLIIESQLTHFPCWAAHCQISLFHQCCGPNLCMLSGQHGKQLAKFKATTTLKKTHYSTLCHNITQWHLVGHTSVRHCQENVCYVEEICHTIPWWRGMNLQMWHSWVYSVSLCVLRELTLCLVHCLDVFLAFLHSLVEGLHCNFHVFYCFVHCWDQGILFTGTLFGRKTASEGQNVVTFQMISLVIQRSSVFLHKTT